MDVEKLIRRLRNDADAYRNGETLGRAFADQEDVLDNAATALSTLQAENEKLRNEVERQRRSADDRKHLYENAERAYMKVVAELEQVKRERDAAQSLLAERIGVRGAEPITTAFGLPIDRLRELAQADREGRCVVPPCKVGQKVKVDVRTWGNVWNYKTVENGKFLIGEIVAITKTKKQTLVKIRVEHNVSWKRPTRRYPASAIGKTVFLTRAEAEEALRREQDEQIKP